MQYTHLLRDNSFFWAFPVRSLSSETIGCRPDLNLSSLHLYTLPVKTTQNLNIHFRAKSPYIFTIRREHSSNMIQKFKKIT